MFISKRTIKKKKYFYLEDRIGGIRTSISLGQKGHSPQRAESAFAGLLQKRIASELKYTQKKYKTTCLDSNEVLALERLKIDYTFLQKFFEESFEEFKENEFVRYAQGSASVEGNSLSLQEANLVLTKGISIAGKKIDEVKEIENMQLARTVARKIKDVNEKNIKKIHAAIMKGFDDKRPGEYRDGPMFITGSKVQPPGGEDVPKEMEKLLGWHNKNKEHIHPVELASEFHARFEEIHPFLDGNGRTGREILNAILRNNGYPRTIINLENRESYILLLERVQISKDYNKFTKFIYLALEKRAEEINKIISENKKTIIKKMLKKSGLV